MVRQGFSFLIFLASTWHVAAPVQAGPAELAAAMVHVQAARWDEAEAATSDQPLLEQDIVTWHRLRSGQGSFEQYRDFLKRRADWPGLPLLREVGERAILRNADPGEVATYFAAQLPRSGWGSLRLADALDQIGAHPIAADEIRRAWLFTDLSATEMAEMRAHRGELIADLYEERLDRMIWDGRLSQAEAVLPFVSPTARALAETRIMLLRNSNGVDERIAALPEATLSDPGLAHARFVWRLGRGLRDEAAGLALAQSALPGGLGRAEAWAEGRERLARLLLQEGKAADAYLLARLHGLRDGNDYAQLEWLAGYIALRHLDRPEQALDHFRRFRVAVDTPISLGRAGYWEGRALDALDRSELAKDAYAFGAEFQTSFYGQLAAEAAGLPMDEELAGSEVYPDLNTSPLAESSVLKAALRLREAGQDLLARRFLRHLAEAASTAEQGALADLALKLNMPHAALYLAKYAAGSGNALVRPYFPIPDALDVADTFDPALVLAVVRRESEFNEDAQSRAGALGLMQLMPATARSVAADQGLKISTSDLTGDPDLNVQLGTAYLEELMAELDGYLPAVVAAYNAGPGRPRAWLIKNGDPRGDLHEAVDWIEAIPFAETRNYVMRVLESREVYRARLAGEAVPWSLAAALTGAGS